MMSVGPTVSLVVESVTLVVLPAASVMEAESETTPCASALTSTARVANRPEAGVPQVALAAIEPICALTARPSSEHVPEMEYAAWFAAVMTVLPVMASVGAVASIVQLKVAGEGSTLLARSIARTAKLCAPSARPV